MCEVKSCIVKTSVLAGEIAVPCNLQSAIAGVMSCLGFVICNAALDKWR